MSTTRQYELVYIVTPEASEQEIADLHTQIEQIVQRFNGTFDKTENWGRKRLAYDIGHHREGTYVVETITGSGELMKEIDRRLRVIDQVIRHLVVRVDEELRVAQRTSEARKAFVARRRVARGLPPERQPGEGRGDGDSQDDMIDVTGTDVAPGDEVVIIGRQGGESLDVREIAASIGTIPYELLCRVGARIERVYS